MNGTRTTPYAVVAPCIDYQGHRFVAARPSGTGSYALIVCERCGKQAAK